MGKTIEQAKAEVDLKKCPFCEVEPVLRVPYKYSTGYNTYLTEVECPECRTVAISEACDNRVSQIYNAARLWNQGHFEPGRKEIEVLKKKIKKQETELKSLKSDLDFILERLREHSQARFLTRTDQRQVQALQEIINWYELKRPEVK